MQAPPPTASLATAMEAVGFSTHERTVATILAHSPGASAGHIAKKAQLHRNQVYRALRGLEAEGLLTSEGTRPERFALTNGEALRSRIEQALRRHQEAARTLLDVWHGLEAAPPAGFSRPVPAPLLETELAEFQSRTLEASLDTWPLEFSSLPHAPRRVTLPGRATGAGVRNISDAHPMRYLVASDACLLVEGPAKTPSAQVIESRAAVAAFKDHFDRVWAEARPTARRSEDVRPHR